MERKVGDKMKNIIEIKNLCRQFDKFVAVNNISFTVKQGELFAFLGTNGAGKSTTISMICTLLPKTSGSIIVDGFNTDKEAAKVRSRLGVVFQTNVLDDLLTVGDNLNTRARFQGLCGDELHCRINELRDVFGLSDIWKRPFGKLSGGQKRKCEIARAILNKPEILILDEPTTGLDPQTRTAIWKLIRDMQTQQGMTVFLTTHYMEEAAAADNVLILEKGRRHLCLYDTGLGSLTVGIYTSQLDVDLNESGGTLEIAYTLDVDSNLSSQNLLHVEVTPVPEPPEL